MKPDATKHNPDPVYLRGLLEKAGLTQRAAAEAIGISPRLLRYCLTDRDGDHREAPYPVQYALERLAMEPEKLTRDLIESHLFSLIDLRDQKQPDGVYRWAWDWSEFGTTFLFAEKPDVVESAPVGVHRFASRDSAMRFAFMWISQNLPNMEEVAVNEAREGLRYRAAQKAKAV